MTDIDLYDGMTAVAAEAPPPPADLIGRVERGHRRQRRRRAATATFAAVVLLAAGSWAALRLPSDRDPTPVAPPVPPPVTFTIPDPDAVPAPVTTTWPGALTGPQEPADAPGRVRAHVIDRLDAGHLLMADADGAFSAYEVATGTFRTLVADSGTRVPDNTGRVVRSPSWIVWVSGDPYPKTSMSVWKAPITGGERQLVGTVDAGPALVSAYATDDHLYWSMPPGSFAVAGDRVMRMSLADGTVEPLAGFDDLTIDGTAWATGSAKRQAQDPPSAPTSFRNVVTGENRPIVTSPDDDSSKCVPAFCLVSRGGKWFVQRLDGSLRTALPWSGKYDLLGASGESGLILLPDNSLLDPVTGKRGIAAPGGGQGCLVRYGSLKGQAYFRWATRTGSGCSPRQLVYIGAGD